MAERVRWAPCMLPGIWRREQRRRQRAFLGAATLYVYLDPEGGWRWRVVYAPRGCGDQGEFSPIYPRRSEGAAKRAAVAMARRIVEAARG